MAQDFDWTKMIVPITIGALILIFSNVFDIWFSIIVTILGLIYIFSPIDFIPEAILGPIGLADDLIVLIAIIGSWVIYFITPAINIILWVLFGLAVIIGIVYAITKLSGKEPERYVRGMIRR